MTEKRKPTHEAQPKDEPDENRAPTRRGFFGVLKKAAHDEVIRRTSTKR
jgi:hypothetical protein